ncbi:hypothetical protein IEQ34_002422 [Dendrobium chrysotoxum]|uniref:Uncharacterized protein n=1 Tax=Dendrobium chrysotoxum TaxID=161865 RepID=A0AAV7HPI8_DENCH|nr:hypothetical protein IEQ34_002422 [Dendrobium chrysotoxum]
MPVSCWKKGIKMAMVSWGRYRRWMMLRHGCWTVLDSSLAAWRSAYSRWMSSVPRILRSMVRACSWWPRWMRELGVSGRKREPRVMMAAGTAARARLTRQPQPPLILAVP